MFAFAIAVASGCTGIALAAPAVDASGKARQADGAPACSSDGGTHGKPWIPQTDVWRGKGPYGFPFNGFTPKGRGKILWKKIKSSFDRKTHYPAPNLPSCRIAMRGSEDRTSRKLGQFVSRLNPIDNQRTYQFKDSFDRIVATIKWESRSLAKRRPERWGWHVDGQWAGHGGSRAFEVQGEACKLRVQTDIVIAGVPPAPVQVRRWVRDRGYAMVAFNPALGSADRRSRPRNSKQFRLRAFVDKRALPGFLRGRVKSMDFGCGEGLPTPMLAPQTLINPHFESGYGPNRGNMVGQYFGESPSPAELLPGESRSHNNMPYSVYSPKPRFGNAMYAMNNTTGIAGGGMVRGLVRGGVDAFVLHDEMTYCDPNYTLRGMLLRRNGRRVSKWKYFELANFSAANRPSVRWVYGEVAPNPVTLAPEAVEASYSPASQRLYAWIPLPCDR